MRERGYAHQPHHGADFELEQFKHARDARFAGGSERQSLELADPDRACAERDRFDHVGAAQNASVDQHLGASVDCGDDFRQHLDARLRVIELPPAMVRDVNDIGAMLDRKARVLR